MGYGVDIGHLIVMRHPFADYCFCLPLGAIVLAEKSQGAIAQFWFKPK
jgi:hypothetical protein